MTETALRARHDDPRQMLVAYLRESCGFEAIGNPHQRRPKSTMGQCYLAVQQTTHQHVVRLADRSEHALSLHFVHGRLASRVVEDRQLEITSAPWYDALTGVAIRAPLTADSGCGGAMQHVKSGYHELACLLALVLAIAIPEACAAVTKPQLSRESVAARLATVRVPFVANTGQLDPRVSYYAPTFAGTVFVTNDGRVVYALTGGGGAPTSHAATGERSSQRVERQASKRGALLEETAVAGSPHPSASAYAPTRVAYFVGRDPTRWRSDVPTFDAISFGEVWPRIRLDLAANGSSVEKRFTVLPGGDPSRIRMHVAGGENLRIDPSGALIVATANGDVTFTAPTAFQERNGARHGVRVAYALHGRRDYGFRVFDYDPALPLLIDPLLQATYLGGSGVDAAYGLAIHPVSGDVYVAGVAASVDFPGTLGGAQPARSTKNDAFVARLDAALTVLEQATYLGGVEDDQANAIAIHPATGDVYVAGQTFSTNFPGTAGGAQATNGTFSMAAFVARLNAGLTTLDQATYFGGGVTVAYALAIHPASGDVYAAGSAISVILPGTAGGAQPDGGGAVDGFVARFNAALTTLGQATYLGGSGGDTVHGLAIHPTSGDVYATGDTSSTNFPGTAGSAQATHGVDFGNSDAFVASLGASLTTLHRSTYVGGNNQETGQALAIHATTGDVYVAGWTQSTNFPGTTGGAQSTFIGGSSAFLAYFDAALTTLHQATYLGTSGANRAFALAIHPASSDIYVAGYTTGDFPGTSGGAQSTFGGFQDAFVAHLNSALTVLDQSTYLGGSSADMAEALAIHPATGQIYVAGPTQSTNFPGTAGGAQATHGADGTNSDGFAARLTPDLTASAVANANLSSLVVSTGVLAPAFNASTIGYSDGVPFGVTSVTIAPTVADGSSTVTVNGVAVTSGTASAPIALSVGGNSIAVVVTAFGGATKTYTVNVVRAAALFRGYLSSHGNDANPCTLPLPCRLLPQALLAIGDGGEIWILDSANYNTGPVDITKSVTILAIPGVIGSIVASGGDAIDIDTPGVRVALRNLVLLNLGDGTNGVNFMRGLELTIEGCEMYGMGASGVTASASDARFAMTNSVSRDNGAYGVSITAAVSAALDGVHLLNNVFSGLLVGGDADVTLANSVAANNGTFGVSIQANAGTMTRALVERSVLRANAGGVEGFAGAGKLAQIAVSRSSLTDNGAGVSASTNAGGSIAIVLTGDVVSGNATGIVASGAGSSVVYSRQNNTLTGNTTDLSGATLTALPGK